MFLAWKEHWGWVKVIGDNVCAIAVVGTVVLSGGHKQVIWLHKHLEFEEAVSMQWCSQFEKERVFVYYLGLLHTELEVGIPSSKY